MNAVARLITNTRKFTYVAPSSSLVGCQRSHKIPSVTHCLQVCKWNDTWLSVRTLPTSFFTTRMILFLFCWLRPCWLSTCSSLHMLDVPPMANDHLCRNAHLLRTHYLNVLNIHETLPLVLPITSAMSILNNNMLLKFTLPQYRYLLLARTKVTSSKGLAVNWSTISAHK